jgi:hypothetical protein
LVKKWGIGSVPSCEEAIFIFILEKKQHINIWMNKPQWIHTSRSSGPPDQIGQLTQQWQEPPAIGSSNLQRRLF